MRTLLLVTLSMLLLVTLVPQASAIPPVCAHKDVDAGVVKVSATYGFGCREVEVERCTFRSDPENPSHPTWTCTTLVRV